MHTSICTECSHYHAAESGRFVGSLTPSAPLKLSLFARDGAGKMMDALCYSAHTETDWLCVDRTVHVRSAGCWGACLLSTRRRRRFMHRAIELRKSTDDSGSPVQSFRRARCCRDFMRLGRVQMKWTLHRPVIMADGRSNLGGVHKFGLKLCGKAQALIWNFIVSKYS
jgi:hypothetical protein